MPITSRCVVGWRNDQSPNSYLGCKNWRRQGGKVEQFKYIITVFEHNHAVVKVVHQYRRDLAYKSQPHVWAPPYLSLSLFSLISLSYNSYSNWSEGCMQSYKLLQLGQGLSRQRFFTYFGLKCSHFVQYKLEYNLYNYTVNFSEVLSDRVIKLSMLRRIPLIQCHYWLWWRRMSVWSQYSHCSE